MCRCSMDSHTAHTHRCACRWWRDMMSSIRVSSSSTPHTLHMSWAEHIWYNSPYFLNTLRRGTHTLSRCSWWGWEWCPKDTPSHNQRHASSNPIHNSHTHPHPCKLNKAQHTPGNCQTYCTCQMNNQQHTHCLPTSNYLHSWGTPSMMSTICRATGRTGTHSGGSRIARGTGSHTLLSYYHSHIFWDWIGCLGNLCHRRCIEWQTCISGRVPHTTSIGSCC